MDGEAIENLRMIEKLKDGKCLFFFLRMRLGRCKSKRIKNMILINLLLNLIRKENDRKKSN